MGLFLFIKEPHPPARAPPALKKEKGTQMKYDNYNAQQLANLAKELIRNNNDLTQRLTSKDINDTFDAVLITKEIKAVHELPKTIDIDDILNHMLTPRHVIEYKKLRLVDYEIRMFDNVPVVYTTTGAPKSNPRTILKEEDEFEIDYKLVQWLLQWVFDEPNLATT